VVDFEAGDRRRAIQIASGVVDAAEREGDVRIFLDGGRPVERLLRALVHAAPLPYAERLIHASQLAHDPAKGSMLGLSKRELEVARYLPTPLSSAEIAERLYISLNTLKTHLRTVYGKLGATNRREAIERAQEAGIA
jgi:LuxR family maltose regulon positive regulatory protein